MKLIKDNPVITTLFLLILALGINYSSFLFDNPRESKAEKACKKAVVDTYSRIKIPLKNQLKQAEQEVLAIDPTRERLKALDREFRRKWWDCRIKFMEANDIKDIQDQQRWEDYSELPQRLEDILDRYEFHDANAMLMNEGKHNSSSKIREDHEKLRK